MLLSILFKYFFYKYPPQTYKLKVELRNKTALGATTNQVYKFSTRFTSASHNVYFQRLLLF